jgi:hypothetical protein
MQPFYSIYISLFFSITPEHSDTSAPVWHEFNNSVTADTRLFHLQLLTNSHFHFLIIVELVTCQVLLQNPELHSSFCFRNEMAHLTACRGPDCNCSGVCKLVSRGEKRNTVLRDYIEKQWHLVEYKAHKSCNDINLIFTSKGTLLIEHVNQSINCPHTQTLPSSSVSRSTYKFLHAGLYTLHYHKHLAHS